MKESRSIPPEVLKTAHLMMLVSLINKAEVTLSTLRRDQRHSIEENPESQSVGVVVRIAEGYLEQAKDQLKILLCPMFVYHETHRYCPSCPWTEKDG